MVDREGQQLGNYRLVRALGQGGFADVYLAEHIYLKSQLAIKFLRAKVVSQDDLDAFLKEAQTIARLIHPNIIRVTDFGVDGEIPFLVMDYAPNGTLRQRHRVGTALPLNTIVPYVRQIAAALQHAHDEKIIHRDIKPENMLVGRRNEILLSDFGIALIAQSTRSQAAQEMVGTVAYMAPEQIQGRPRPASDQYALAVVVYEWLSGVRPFYGSFTEVCAQHVLAPPPPLREKVPTIAPEVEQVIMTALAKDFRERFVNVQAFATALEQAYLRTSFQPVMFQHSSSSSPADPAKADVQEDSEIATVLIDRTRLPSGSKQQLSTDGSHAAASLQTPEIAVTGKDAEKVQPRRGISRRAAIIGLTAGGLAIAAGGGAAAWLLRSQQTPVVSPPSDLSPSLYVYKGHDYPVMAVTWSLDGRRIASASRDHTVQVWDAFSGSHVLTYRGHTDIVWCVAWSPDGNYIASASHDHTVQVWDAVTGTPVRTYLGHKDVVWWAAWSPDSKRLASGSVDKTVQVWDALSGQRLYTYNKHADAVRGLTWSPSGTLIASGSWDFTVQVWEAANGKQHFTYRGHTDRVATVAWSPDGKHIASGSRDGTAQVWSAADGSNPFIYTGNANTVGCLAWSLDSRRIASASRLGVKVWDATDGGHTFYFHGNRKAVSAVAWSHDGKYLASGSDDNIVQVWKAQ
jgi:eukaryotic-like serine/threonine-protein kinase